MMEMIEQDPAKRISKNIELVLSHKTPLENHSLKTHPMQKTSTTTSTSGLEELIKTGNYPGILELPLPSGKNPLELKGFAITDHMKETIDTHRKLHSKTGTIRKHTRI